MPALVCTFGNLLAHFLVAAHTVNNLDICNEQGFENEGYDFFVSGDQIQKIFNHKRILL